MARFTYLDLVDQVDGFPSPASHPIQHAERLSGLHLFTAGTHTLGYVLPAVVAALHEAGPCWKITPTTVSLAGESVEERTRNMATTLAAWRDNGTFRVVAAGSWRNELYSVYSPNGELYLRLERSGAALFGVVTYGVSCCSYYNPWTSADRRQVHMTAFVPATAAAPLRLWTPRRNVSKATYGGMLDNTVAGGIASGTGAFETLVKEAAEEASLPEALVREQARAVGVLSYFYVRDARAGGETGLLQPEIEYVYELKLGEDVIPAPCDDEVQDFHLMPVEEVSVYTPLVSIC